MYIIYKKCTCQIVVQDNGWMHLYTYKAKSFQKYRTNSFSYLFGKLRTLFHFNSTSLNNNDVFGNVFKRRIDIYPAYNRIVKPKHRNTAIYTYTDINQSSLITSWTDFLIAGHYQSIYSKAGIQKKKNKKK